MTNEKIICPKCNGLIAIPAEFTGKLECPRCDELVYSRDADTGVTWSATRQASPVPPPSPAPSPDNVIPPILAQTPEVEQKDQRPYVVPICLTLGALGVFSSVVVSTGGFPGLLLNAVLNPLIWAGCAGLFLLFKRRKPSRRNESVYLPSPVVPLLKNKTSQLTLCLCVFLSCIGIGLGLTAKSPGQIELAFGIVLFSLIVALITSIKHRLGK